MSTIETISTIERRAPQLPRITDEPRLKVGVIAACPFPANHGTPGSIRELSEATADRGHEVHVITYHFGEELPLRGVNLHRIPDWTGETAITVGPTRNRPLYDMLLVFKAIQVVRKYDLDVIHAHGYEAALAAGLCRLATGRRIVYSAHNTMEDELASYDFFKHRFVADGLAWLLDRTVPRIGNRCIPHSHNMVEFLKQRGLENRCEDVVHWGVSLDEFPADEGAYWRSQYGITDEPVVLYAGVLDKFQRIDLLVDGMLHVVQQQPRAKLVFVVTVPCEKHVQSIREHAQRLGIQDNIILTEPQDMDGALKHLWMADVTVVPRPQTPAFPIKLLNYMATLRPTVMFASSASGVTHGKNIWTVDQDTPEALADGLLHLLSRPNLREHIAQNAYDFVCENHDRRRLAVRVCETYLRALRGTRRWKKIGRRPPLHAHPELTDGSTPTSELRRTKLK